MMRKLMAMRAQERMPSQSLSQNQSGLYRSDDNLEAVDDEVSQIATQNQLLDPMYLPQAEDDETANASKRHSRNRAAVLSTALRKVYQAYGVKSPSPYYPVTSRQIMAQALAGT